MNSHGRLDHRIDWYRKSFWTGFTVYVWLIFSSSIAILHNHPVNEISPRAESDLSLRSFDPDGTQFQSPTQILHDRFGFNEIGFGITYGVPYEPLRNQVDWIFLGGLPSTILWSIVFMSVLIIMASYVQNRVENALSIGMIVGLAISICALYLIFTLVVFDLIPHLKFYSNTGETFGILESLLRMEIGHVFYLLILTEGVFFAGIINLWLQPFMPERISKKLESDAISKEDIDKISLYITKWSQYGSWLVAVFGGAILSMAVLYLTEVRLFGGLVIRHVIILFGGALIFYIYFVVCKVDVIERAVVR